MAQIDQTAEATKDICWARGDFDPKIFTITDSLGVAIDISTSTFIFSLDVNKDPTDVLTQVFTAVGTFVTDGTDGKVQFQPANATETDVAAGKYFYDIQETLTGGQVRTLIKGVAKIIMDITKA